MKKVREQLERLRNEIILEGAAGNEVGCIVPETFDALTAVLEYADELDEVPRFASVSHTLRTIISESLIGC